MRHDDRSASSSAQKILERIAFFGKSIETWISGHRQCPFILFGEQPVLDETDGTITLPFIPYDTYLAEDRYLEELAEMWLIQPRTGG